MERRKRYQEKLNFLIDTLALFNSDPKTRDQIDALLYRVQISIETTMDLCAMLTKDLGITVGDDYENISKLVEKGAISEELGEDLKELNGLRNAVVHKYNHFEEEAVTEHVEDIKAKLKNFVKVVDEKKKALFKED